MDVDTAAQEAMGKVVMAQMQQHTLAAIRQAVREEVLEEVKQQAFQDALAELDDRLAREKERLRDVAAKEKKALAGELEDELERREEALRREIREHYEERLETLKDDLKAATAAKDQATALLVALVTQLVVEKPKRYLADAGLTELDLVTLNQVLAPQGLRVQAEYRHSERQVTCTLKNGAAQRTVFWQEPVRPGAPTAEA